jgi:hypothetical protein
MDDRGCENDDNFTDFNEAHHSASSNYKYTSNPDMKAERISQLRWFIRELLF